MQTGGKEGAFTGGKHGGRPAVTPELLEIGMVGSTPIGAAGNTGRHTQGHKCDCKKLHLRTCLEPAWMLDGKENELKKARSDVETKWREQLFPVFWRLAEVYIVIVDVIILLNRFPHYPGSLIMLPRWPQTMRRLAARPAGWRSAFGPSLNGFMGQALRRLEKRKGFQ